MDSSVVLSGQTAEKRSGPADQAEIESAYKLSGETAEKRPGPADLMCLPIGEAEVETAHKLSIPPEHPRVTRLRHRRLIAFLRDQGFRDSYKELMNKTRSHMSPGHLRGLVKRGRWVDAVEYLDRYLPPPTSPKSYDAMVLRKFLLIHHRFANAADGRVDKFVLKNYLQLNNGRAVSHGVLRIRSILSSVLSFEEVRVNMNWEGVRDRASILVSRLARSTPELRGCIALPATAIKPHHVFPIASGLWSRRRYVKKKQTERSEAIVRALKSQQLMVPRIGSVEEAQELLADLLDESLQYGVQLNTYRLNRQIQPGRNEGAQLCNPMFGTSAEAKTYGALANAGCRTYTASQELAVTELKRQLTLQRLIGTFGEASPADASVVFSGKTAEKRSGLEDQVEVEIAYKLCSETAQKRSGLADDMGHSVGEAEVEIAHKLSSPPEHPRLTRLRHRRLIAFLWDQGFRDAYKELTNKTRSHMSLGHLRGLVKRGRWVDAVEYLDRYLPPPTSPKSYHALVLRKFLLIHQRFANGIVNKSVLRNYFQLNNGRAISHANLRLRSIYSILASEEVRVNVNWERVRDRASIVVSRLARSTTELRGCIALPATSNKLHHVLPIASGLWSRRRYVKKKQTGRPEAIVRALKSQQLMVPRIGSIEEAKELLADLLDESVRYCVQLNTYGLNRPLQPGRNEGAQLCQHMFCTSTEAKTSRTLATAGTHEHVVEAGRHTNTASQEWALTELERQLKRQRLIGAFGEAQTVVPEPLVLR